MLTCTSMKPIHINSINFFFIRIWITISLLEICINGTCDSTADLYQCCSPLRCIPMDTDTCVGSPLPPHRNLRSCRDHSHTDHWAKYSCLIYQYMLNEMLKTFRSILHILLTENCKHAFFFTIMSNYKFQRSLILCY